MITAECRQGMARQIRNATFTLVDHGTLTMITGVPHLDGPDHHDHESRVVARKRRVLSGRESGSASERGRLGPPPCLPGDGGSRLCREERHGQDGADRGD
jgi:hypothetical protein